MSHLVDTNISAWCQLQARVLSWMHSCTPYIFRWCQFCHVVTRDNISVVVYILVVLTLYVWPGRCICLMPFPRRECHFLVWLPTWLPYWVKFKLYSHNEILMVSRVFDTPWHLNAMVFPIPQMEVNVTHTEVHSTATVVVVVVLVVVVVVVVALGATNSFRTPSLP